MVPGEEYPHHSTTSPRSPELHSRHGVPEYGGQYGLEARSDHLQRNRQMLQPNRSGPICLAPNQSMPTLLQLAARSLCSSNRRIPPGLDTDEGFRQPSMGSDRPDPTCSNPTGQDSATGPSLEIPTLVPNSLRDVDRAPPANTAQQSDQRGSRTDVPNPKTGRMAYLRERFRSQNLSEEATSLLLSSWRSKTNRSYDSLFGKWSSWCSEWNADPILAPVTDVARSIVINSSHQSGDSGMLTHIIAIDLFVDRRNSRPLCIY